MRNAHKNTILIILICITACVIFYSCSDNTVAPAIRGLDAPRYNWLSDSLNTGLVNGIASSDTNNVIFLCEYNIFQYDGTRYNNYPFPNSFLGRCIDGFDRSNLYIGGLENISNGRNMIEKWNGSKFKTYFINDPVIESNIIYCIKDLSPNNVWAGTSKGQLYHYDGVSSVTYTIDTLAVYNFLLDNSNNLYCVLANGPSPDPIYHGTNVSIYKLTGNVWTKIYFHYFNETEDVLFPQELSGRFLAFTKKAAYEFIPPLYTKIFDINQFNVTNIWSGNSFNNILNAGGSFNDVYPHLFHYNGFNWSDEIKLAGHNIYVKFIQNKYYCISNDLLDNTSVIYRGTSKK